MDDIYEEIFGDVRKRLDAEKKKINVRDVEKTHAKRTDPNVKDTNSNYNDGKVPINGAFIEKLIRYIDSVLPKHLDVGNKVGHELRSIMVVGDGKELKKTEKKISNIVSKAQIDMLDKIKTRVSKVLVEPK